MNKVSIVTINYNQDKITEELLVSIAETNTYANIETIVVDNGSTHNPVPEWTTKFPDVKFIRSESNLGFSGGNNLGIADATGDYYFLVNNDTEFTPGLVQKLVDILDTHPHVGIISPKLMYHFNKNIIQYVGFTQVDYYTCRNRAVGKNETDKGQYDNLLGQTGYCHGGAMMVKRETCAKAGLMADNFFIYYEEVDWGERINKSGYQAWVRGDAVIYHKESMTVGKKSAFKEYFMNRNRILFIRHNAPAFKALVFYFYFMLMVVPRNIVNYIKEGKTEFISILFRAIWWNVTHSKHSTELGFTPNKVK
ncbi:glycosyltransferase family 2 protein [Mucilaginibacter pallidiroseus]|uniref:Glycosyltransferase family 2 protein n=1 Tax=Mucilaginibacter pallidiroseus TaxID=2599295 RepID=A0A563UJB8_9SPHI|nr:glycosyltransferase family 2 protein [Mucilaginibacter pallidiroseus]TWR31467.1 glycosyltransferase family 2 protein [Mucilaginibacter pallidiroseus]